MITIFDIRAFQILWYQPIPIPDWTLASGFYQTAYWGEREQIPAEAGFGVFLVGLEASLRALCPSRLCLF